MRKGGKYWLLLYSRTLNVSRSILPVPIQIVICCKLKWCTTIIKQLAIHKIKAICGFTFELKGQCTQFFLILALYVFLIKSILNTGLSLKETVKEEKVGWQITGMPVKGKRKKKTCQERQCPKLWQHISNKEKQPWVGRRAEIWISLTGLHVNTETTA